MKIGIIGSGDVGQALGTGLTSHGHEIMIGSRTPDSEKLRAWKEASGATTGTPADAAAFGEWAIVATNFNGAEDAIKLAGPENLAGKIVVDVTNPLDFSEGDLPHFAVPGGTSAGELVQSWLPDSRVVKAFNIINARFMIDPEFSDGPPTMFIAGDDEGARGEVAGLLESVGWEVADLGPMEGARYIEGLAMCWIWYGFRTGIWDHAFKLIRP